MWTLPEKRSPVAKLPHDANHRPMDDPWADSDEEVFVIGDDNAYTTALAAYGVDFDAAADDAWADSDEGEDSEAPSASAAGTAYSDPYVAPCRWAYTNVSGRSLFTRRRAAYPGVPSDRVVAAGAIVHVVERVIGIAEIGVAAEPLGQEENHVRLLTSTAHAMFCVLDLHSSHSVDLRAFVAAVQRDSRLFAALTTPGLVVGLDDATPARPSDRDAIALFSKICFEARSVGNALVRDSFTQWYVVRCTAEAAAAAAASSVFQRSRAAFECVVFLRIEIENEVGGGRSSLAPPAWVFDRLPGRDIECMRLIGLEEANAALHRLAAEKEAHAAAAATNARRLEDLLRPQTLQVQSQSPRRSSGGGTNEWSFGPLAHRETEELPISADGYDDESRRELAAMRAWSMVQIDATLAAVNKLGARSSGSDRWKGTQESAAIRLQSIWRMRRAVHEVDIHIELRWAGKIIHAAVQRFRARFRAQKRYDRRFSAATRIQASWRCHSNKGGLPQMLAETLLSQQARASHSIAARFEAKRADVDAPYAPFYYTNVSGSAVNIRVSASYPGERTTYAVEPNITVGVVAKKVKQIGGRRVTFLRLDSKPFGWVFDVLPTNGRIVMKPCAPPVRGRSRSSASATAYSVEITLDAPLKLGLKLAMHAPSKRLMVRAVSANGAVGECGENGVRHGDFISRIAGTAVRPGWSVVRCVKFLTSRVSALLRVLSSSLQLSSSPSSPLYPLPTPRKPRPFQIAFARDGGAEASATVATAVSALAAAAPFALTRSGNNADPSICTVTVRSGGIPLGLKLKVQDGTKRVIVRALAADGAVVVDAATEGRAPSVGDVLLQIGSVLIEPGWSTRRTVQLLTSQRRPFTIQFRHAAAVV